MQLPSQWSFGADGALHPVHQSTLPASVLSLHILGLLSACRHLSEGQSASMDSSPHAVLAGGSSLHNLQMITLPVVLDLGHTSESPESQPPWAGVGGEVWV